MVEYRKLGFSDTFKFEHENENRLVRGEFTVLGGLLYESEEAAEQGSLAVGAWICVRGRVSDGGRHNLELPEDFCWYTNDEDIQPPWGIISKSTGEPLSGFIACLFVQTGPTFYDSITRCRSAAWDEEKGKTNWVECLKCIRGHARELGASVWSAFSRCGKATFLPAQLSDLFK